MGKKEWKVGDEVPSLSKEVTREGIKAYAEATGDFNPIHLDEAFAISTPFGGIVAHGMLILAYISEMMAGAFGENWVSRGKLKVRFRAPARPGDVISAYGVIKGFTEKDDHPFARLEVGCRNQVGEAVITGEAEVPLD